ncbi:MAG: hypothetical protein CL459_00825 [Acidimicrobiaceae bacterium]|nr:hypothetical protein [Acidimicrobiaceae bacterium]|tara:strand:+ start:2315 stop:3394 length:1080 start_codon:yes stop_codon:yes gene_type:complete
MSEAPIELGPSELRDLATGCTVLAGGGGGDPRVGLLMALHAVATTGPVPLVHLDDLDPDGLVLPSGMIGAPTVMIEKIPNGGESRVIRSALEARLAKSAVALMCLEMGGINGVLPVAWAANAGLPIVDGDLMGRAFPEVQMCTPHLHGIPACPCAVADERLQVITYETRDNVWLEKLARNTVSTLGGCACSSLYPMTAAQATKPTIHGTLSMAISVGRAIRTAPDDPFESLDSLIPMVRLLEGKVTDVERRTEGGFVRGSATLAGTGVDAGRSLTIEFQNENLVAIEDGEPLATVPDIITLLDSHTSHGIVTEHIRYGQRVVVAVFPAPRQWTSKDGLAVVGPRVFGYDFDYRPAHQAA